MQITRWLNVKTEKLMVDWRGVYPAVTTQFREDFSLDLEATGKVIEALIRDGVADPFWKGFQVI